MTRINTHRFSVLDRMTPAALTRLLIDAVLATASGWHESPGLDEPGTPGQIGNVLHDLRITADALAARYRHLATAHPAPVPIAAAAGATTAARLLGQACIVAEGLPGTGPVIPPPASVPEGLLCCTARHLATIVLPSQGARELAATSHALALALTAAGVGTGSLAARPGPHARRLAAIRACLDTAAAPLTRDGRRASQPGQARRTSHQTFGSHHQAAPASATTRMRMLTRASFVQLSVSESMSCDATLAPLGASSPGFYTSFAISFFPRVVRPTIHYVGAITSM